MADRFGRTLELAVDGALVLAIGLFVTLPVLVVLEHMVLIGVLATGAGLVLARWLFLWASPWMATHSQLVADLVNLVIWFCRAMWYFTVELEHLLVGLWDTIEDISKDIGHDLHLGTLPKLKATFDSTAAVSGAQIHKALTEIVRTCHPYDEAWKVIYHTVKVATNSYACAMVRYVYPVEWLAPIAEYWLSPFYDGSADPLSTYDAPANCEHTLDDTTTTSGLCSAIGSGYVVLEVFLRGLVVAIVLVALWGGIWAILKAAARLGWQGLRVAWAVIDDTVIKFAL